MLKKMIIVLFVGVISSVSMTASAISNEPNGNVKSSLSGANNTTNKDIPIQVTGIGKDDVKTTISYDANESEPIMPTVWLLIMALFGYVMLSNRSSV